METILIDLSYMIFYKFYAIKSYIKTSKRESEVSCNIDDEIFIKHYDSSFEKTVRDLCMRTKCKKVILLKDCQRENIWRRQYKPDYKNRKGQQDFDGRIFVHTIDNLIPKIKSSCLEYKFRRKLHPVKLWMMEWDVCEADDLAYIYCRKMCSNEKKLIITADMDYMQLLDDTTEVQCLKAKSMREKSLGSNEKDILLKVMCGDKSDNVPALMSEKKVRDILADADDESFSWLCERFSAEIGNEKFEKNMMMVNMTYIPETIMQDVLGKYHDLIHTY